MNIKYIVVQAGGKGTRLFPYTRNMPKAMVPVNNRPIIFHLFERFSDCKFIIINDYKSEVLDRYLECFAKVPYVSINVNDEGNIAGIREALRYIPEEEPFLLLWSDLILGENFSVDELDSNEKCYVGITKIFPCSWSSTDGKLDKVKGEKGVAGCFLFSEKSFLNDIPTSGSLTRWLRDNNISYAEMDMKDTVEVGTIEALQRVDSKDNRCRPYNSIKIEGEKVIKEGLTKEAKDLLEREMRWYDYLSKRNYSGIPEIYSRAPLTMRRIHGKNVFLSEVDGDKKQDILTKIIDKLGELHNLESTSPNLFDMEKDYYRKTLNRLRGIESVIPFSNREYIRINGRVCKNVLRLPELLEYLTAYFNKEAMFGILHGDCTFTNTLLDESGEIYFIDARGYFGDTELIGDVDYDWAKVYYSIVGAFDQFNIGRFDLSVNMDSVEFKIRESGWEELEDLFWDKVFSLTEYEHYSKKEHQLRVRFIHAVIWLSLASHCWENYDAMCLAYYNGLYLLNEVADELGEDKIKRILRLSPLQKTWIFDLDGTLVIHNGYKTGDDSLLPGVKEFMSKIPDDDYIMIMTSREKEAREKTENFLKQQGIRYDSIQFEMPMGERLLFNDDKPSGLRCCYGVRHPRNMGLSDMELVIDENL